MSYRLDSLRNLRPPYVFLETLSVTKEERHSFLFSDFKNILTFGPGDNLDLFFRRVENYSRKGYWLAGYFSYEFGYFLEQTHHRLRPRGKTPLVWLGVCRKPEVTVRKNNPLRMASGLTVSPAYSVKNLRPNINRDEYTSKLRRIKAYLKQGLSYQVNFTFKEKFDFKGDVLSLYSDLRRSQPTPYSALINNGREYVLSLSPELFFRIDKNKITARPMKGTAKRGETDEEDFRREEVLKKSRKIRAENLMIVDLLRNDLGRISELVRAPKLFSIEKHPTLYQMTSTIEGRLKESSRLKDIFCSLFPCGSVTGAPKIKTMQIIKELEKEPRGIYTGAIGYVSPKGKTCFNVAIRTVRIKKNKGELGIGGGIVYDSDPGAEYEEARLKAKFFRERSEKASLIEGILWDKDKGYYLLSRHLNRLDKSAQYFSYSYSRREIRKKLKEAVDGEKKSVKVRLILNPDGKITVDKTPIKKIKLPVKIRISNKRIDPKDEFLYHKTTRRYFYDREREKGLTKGCFETVFLNEKGEITEGAITNLFICRDKSLYTPSLQSGLLPGVLREELIKRKKVREKILYLQDLKDADAVYIGNSVRGLIEAKL